MVIGRAQDKNVGAIHARLQRCKARRSRSVIRTVKRQQLLSQIQQINCAAISAQRFGDMPGRTDHKRTRYMIRLRRRARQPAAESSQPDPWRE